MLLSRTQSVLEPDMRGARDIRVHASSVVKLCRDVSVRCCLDRSLLLTGCVNIRRTIEIEEAGKLCLQGTLLFHSRRSMGRHLNFGLDLKVRFGFHLGLHGFRDYEGASSKRYGKRECCEYVHTKC